MHPRLLATTLLVGLGLMLSAAAPRTDPVPLFRLAIQISETRPEGGTVVLAEPLIATPLQKPFLYRVGGMTVPAPGDELFYGVSVQGTLTPMRSGQLRLAARIGLGHNIARDEHGPDTVLVRTDSLDIRTILKIGETKRLHCGGSRTCEIQVDALQP